MSVRTAIRVADRSLAALAFVLALALGILFCAMEIAERKTGFFSLPNGRLVHDFACFWGGARLFWLGQTSLVFEPLQFNQWLATQLAPGTMQDFATWSYPPTMLLVMLPFGLLPLPFAYLAWIGGTFGLLFAALRFALTSPVAVAAVLFSPAAMYTLQYGQNGALTGALLIAGIWAVDRKPVLAGICIGVLVMKPQLGLLLPFALAAGGYWRVFRVAALVALGMVAASAMLFGTASWFGFMDRTAPFMSPLLTEPFGVPPHHAMSTTWMMLRGWGADLHRAAFGQLVSAIFAIGLTVMAWARPGADRRWRNALTWTLPLLSTPYGYVYDATPVMATIVLISEAGLTDGFGWAERPVLLAFWVWPAVTVLWSYVFGWPPVGAVLILGVALCAWWRITPRTAAKREDERAFGPVLSEAAHSDAHG